MDCKDKIKGLYALCDAHFSPAPLPEMARLLLQGGTPILQLRMKAEKDLGRVRAVAQAILEKKKEFRFTFILNDFVEVAEALPVDGLHLGKDDAPLSEARARLGKEKILGFSSHSLEEALQAEASGADYVAFGAIFPTPTKGPGHPVQGLEKLRRVVEAVRIPVVAIGGITKENVASVLDTGVEAVAMITALTLAPDVTEAARWFVEKCKESRNRGIEI